MRYSAWRRAALKKTRTSGLRRSEVRTFFSKPVLYRHKEQGNRVEDILFDLINLYSGYFYTPAPELNRDAGVAETEFKSRVC